MTPIEFASDTQLDGREAPWGLMIWSNRPESQLLAPDTTAANPSSPVRSTRPASPSSSAKPIDLELPDSIWLESRSGLDGTSRLQTEHRLAWSHQGEVQGEVCWRTQASNSTDPTMAHASITGDSLRGPSFERDGTVPMWMPEEKIERIQRAWSFARSLSRDMTCLVMLDPTSLKELHAFASSEVRSLTEIERIVTLQEVLFGADDRSLFDHRRVAEAALAAQVAKGPDEGRDAVVGGWMTRMLGRARPR